MKLTEKKGPQSNGGGKESGAKTFGAGGEVIAQVFANSGWKREDFVSVQLPTERSMIEKRWAGRRTVRICGSLKGVGGGGKKRRLGKWEPGSRKNSFTSLQGWKGLEVTREGRGGEREPTVRHSKKRVWGPCGKVGRLIKDPIALEGRVPTTLKKKEGMPFGAKKTR